MSDEQIHMLQLENQRETLALQFRHKQNMLTLSEPGKSLVYANQQEAAVNIIKQFRSGKVWVALVAPPGAGKTGVILEVLRQLGQHGDPKHQIHIKNMMLMTGMSDTDWAKTMRDGMLDSLHDIVYHRAKLQGKNTLDVMRNGIIVTDECHVACQVDQTIDKKLKEAGLKSIDTLRARNMLMLDVSATPEGVLADLAAWKEHSGYVIMPPDPKYKGFQTMKDEKRLRSAADYDLEKYEQAKALLQLFQDRYMTSSSKKYFPFRVYSAKVRGNIASACTELGWEFEDHDSRNRVIDIDTVMETAPKKHKVFFVKGLWRASKRLVRLHVGGTYESATSRPDDTGKSQGLTARACSTFEWSGEHKNVDLRPLHFDDIESIDRYLNWWAADCDYNEAAYNSPRLKSNGKGTVKHPPSKAHPSTIVGVDTVEEDPVHVPAPAAAPDRQRAAAVGPRIARTGYHRRHQSFTSLADAKAHYVNRFGTEDGFAAKPHKCPDTGKFMCSFSSKKTGVLLVEDVLPRLRTGNLWGANQTKLEGGSPLPRIGTVKIGYTGEVATYFLCVQSKTEFDL
jgi:hypothetical protein